VKHPFPQLGPRLGPQPGCGLGASRESPRGQPLGPAVDRPPVVPMVGPPAGPRRDLGKRQPSTPGSGGPVRRPDASGGRGDNRARESRGRERRPSGDERHHPGEARRRGAGGRLARRARPWPIGGPEATSRPGPPVPDPRQSARRAALSGRTGKIEKVLPVGSTGVDAILPHGPAAHRVLGRSAREAGPAQGGRTTSADSLPRPGREPPPSSCRCSYRNASH